MKKSTKMMTAAVSAVVVLGAALAVVLCLPSDENANINVSDENDILLFDKSNLTAEDITVKNESGEYQLLGYKYANTSSDESDDENQEITVVYTMQGYEDSMLSKLMTDTLVSECRSAAATRMVDKSGRKYVDYGLDKPSCEVKIIYSDNSEIEMSFGNEAPDQSGIYCRIDGDKNVYLVNSASVDMFFLNKLQLFDKTLTNELNDSEDISEITISGSGYEKAINITDEKNNINLGKYRMTSPYRECCNSSAVVNFATEFFDFSLSAVAAAGVKKDDLKNFGLDAPYMDITVDTTEHNTVEILASEKDAGGKYYVMRAGGNIIYSAEENELSWYGVMYQAFLNDSVLMPEMTNINKIEISYNGRNDEYRLENKRTLNDLYEETVTTTLYYHDEVINYSNMYNFITGISAITRGEGAPENLDGCEEIFRISLTFDDEDSTTDTLILYQTSDKKTAAVLNGNIECYVDTEYAQQVIEQSPKIPTDETVQITENGEESSEPS